MNKEKYTEEIQHIISQYLLNQHLKPFDRKNSKACKDFLKELTLCHEMPVYARKTKQTLSQTYVEKLKSLV